jgi:hypothetical protein
MPVFVRVLLGIVLLAGSVVAAQAQKAYFSYPLGAPVDCTEIMGPVRQHGSDVTLNLCTVAPLRSIAGLVGAPSSAAIASVLGGTSGGTLAFGNDSRIVGAAAQTALTAEVSRATTAEGLAVPLSQRGVVNGDVAYAGAVLAITPTAYSSTAIPVGTGEVVVSGSANAFTLTLPTVPLNTRLRIVADPASALLLSNSTVTLQPASGQTIATGLNTTLSLAQPIDLTWNSGTSAWTVHAPFDAAAIATAFSADFVHQVYTGNDGSQAVQTSFDGLFSSGGVQQAQTATYIDASGHMQYGAPGRPRFTYDASTHKPLGLLIEPSTTNVIPSPLTFTTGWSPGSDNQGTITTAIPPFLTGAAIIQHKRDTGTNANVGFFTVPFSPGANGNWQFSLWVYVLDDFVTGTPQIVMLQGSLGSGGTGSVSTGEAFADMTRTNQWQRVTLNISLATATSVNIIMQVTGPSTALPVYSTAWQFENQPFPTSFTPTARTAESLSPGALGLQALAGGAGTLAMKMHAITGTTSLAGTTGTTLALSDGSANNTVSLGVHGGSQPTLTGAMTTAGTAILTQTGGNLSQVSSTNMGQTTALGIAYGPSGVSYADSLGGTGTASGTAPQGLSTFAVTPSEQPIQRIQFTPAVLAGNDLQTFVNTGLAPTVFSDPAYPGAVIPPNFVGFSFEATGYRTLTTAVLPMLNLIGTPFGGTSKGVVRIGGGTSNHYFIQSFPEDITLLGSLMAGLGTGWDLIWCTNMIQGLTTGSPPCPSCAATDITDVLGAAPGHNVLVQIGNEPDDLGTPAVGLEPATWGFGNFVTAWTSFEQAIATANPTVQFAGPDAAQSTNWVEQFSKKATTAPLAKMLTRHLYPLIQGSSYPTVTIPNLFASDLVTGQMLKYEASWAKALGVPIRMTEGNSVSVCTTAAVCQVEASALWFIETAMTEAQNGWAGTNIHTVTSASAASYSPLIIDADGVHYDPQPIYYGMLAVSRLEGCTQLPVTSNVAATQLPVISASCPDGKVRFLMVNKNLTTPVTVQLAQGGTWSTAQMLTLTAPSAASAAVTFGGSTGSNTVSNTGVWTPTPDSIARGAVSTPIPIPAASAVLVALQ